MSRQVFCARLQREAEGLAQLPPLPAAWAQRVYDNVSLEAWEAWRAQQTRIINEYRLILARPDARKFLLDEMEKFLFSGGELAPTGYIPPN